MSAPVTLCPIECVRSACPDPDFIEKNGTWLLTVIAGFSGCMGMLLSYFLKSRCRTVKCCGVQLERDVISLKPSDIEITSSKSNM